MRVMSVLVPLALMMGACSPPPAKAPATPAPSAAAVTAPTLVVNGAATKVAVSDQDLSMAAGVVRVTDLDADGAKIFLTAGGDPAINGLYTYLALYIEDDRDWRVFQIGDFNEVSIVSQTKETVDLKASVSWVDQPTGDIKTEERFMRVSIPAQTDTALTVTPLKAS